MKYVFLFLVFCLPFHKTLYTNALYKTRDSLKHKNNINFIGIQLFGSCIFSSINYKQNLFDRGFYSLGFQIGASNVDLIGDNNPENIIIPFNSLTLLLSRLMGFSYANENFHYYQHHFFMYNRFSLLKNFAFIIISPGLYYLNAYIKEEALNVNNFTYHYLQKYNKFIPVLKSSIEILITKKYSFELNNTFIINHNLYDYNLESPLFFPKYRRKDIYFSLGFAFYYNFGLLSLKIPETNEDGQIKINFIGFSLTNLGINYERILLKKNNNAFSMIFNPSVLPYKRFEVSEKTGFQILTNFYFNYIKKLNEKYATEIGLGYRWGFNLFSIYDVLFCVTSYNFRSNIGIRCSIKKKLLLKINYQPVIYNNYNKEFDNIRKYQFVRINPVNIVIGYMF